jgi:predicted NBD/HSP70 family sugar kinase
MISDAPLRIAGSNAERTRQHNRQVVLAHIRASAPAGRAQIARATGLSTQAVSNIIAELSAEGYLAPAGRHSVGRGQPAPRYALNPDGGQALGIEVRLDAVLLAVVDLGGRVLHSARAALAAPEPGAVAAAVRSLRDRALAAAAPARLLGAGVVMPGPFSATGIIDPAYAFAPGWAGLAPQDWFAAILDLPVSIENDANAAALAERVSGVARGIDTYGFLYFGSGLGLGLVSGGQLYRGAFGNAGEIGQVPVPQAGRMVALEQAVSRAALRRHLRAAGRDAATGEDLAALHAARDPALMRWLDAATGPLSHAIGLIENLFDPQAMILGGAMPDPILDHLIAHLALPAASVSARPDRTLPRVLRGASGRMTATYGAAALVINQTFTPRLAAMP